MAYHIHLCLLTQPSLLAELKRVGTQLIALAQAFDAVEQDSSQLELAELKFKDLLTVGSLEVNAAPVALLYSIARSPCARPC